MKKEAVYRRVRDVIRMSLAVLYLVLVILCIPLAFDVGGTACGLAFSLTIFTLYFVLTTVRLLTRGSRHLRWLSLLYYSQHILLPSLLTLFLLYYRAKTPNQILPVRVWRVLIENSTPVFTILEGFCSLLLIQAVGQTINWLTTYKSDSWLIISLVGSGSTITAANYFLYRIYVFPFKIDTLEASLLGSILTTTFFLGIYGIISGKGSMIELSLLFAYIVRCIYETFPVLSQQASEALTALFTQTTTSLKHEIPILSPQINDVVSHLVPLLASNIPGSFKTVWAFLVMAVQKLTLPVILNLAYRIGVFYAATKIIPSLYNGIATQSITPPRSPVQHSRTASVVSVPSVILSEITAESDTNTRDFSEFGGELLLQDLVGDSSTGLERRSRERRSVDLDMVRRTSAEPYADYDEQAVDSVESADSSSNEPTNDHDISVKEPSGLLRVDTEDRGSSSFVKYQQLKHPRASQSTILKLIYSYSPCIVTAVYTHLMMLYTGELGTELKIWSYWSPQLLVVLHPWEFWNWVNMITTLFLYGAELMGNEGVQGSAALTSHWEVQ